MARDELSARNSSTISPCAHLATDEPWRSDHADNSEKTENAAIPQLMALARAVQLPFAQPNGEPHGKAGKIRFSFCLLP